MCVCVAHGLGSIYMYACMRKLISNSTVNLQMFYFRFQCFISINMYIYSVHTYWSSWLDLCVYVCTCFLLLNIEHFMLFSWPELITYGYLTHRKITVKLLNLHVTRTNKIPFRNSSLYSKSMNIVNVFTAQNSIFTFVFMLRYWLYFFTFSLSLSLSLSLVWKWIFEFIWISQPSIRWTFRFTNMTERVNVINSFIGWW